MSIRKMKLKKQRKERVKINENSSISRFEVDFSSLGICASFVTVVLRFL